MTESDAHGHDFDLAALRQQVAQLDALHRIHRAAASTLDLIPMLNAVTETITEVMECDACSVYLSDERRGVLTLTAITGMPWDAVGAISLPIGEGVTGRAAATHELLTTTEAPAFGVGDIAAPLHNGEWHTQVSVPMEIAAVGKLVGVLNLHFPAGYALPERDRDFLTMVAGELAIAIDHAQLYDAAGEALTRKVEELQTLQRVTAVVTSTLDLTQVLETIAQQAAALGAADMVSIYELSADGEGLNLLAGYETSTGGGERVAEEVRREAVRRAMRATHDGIEATEVVLTGDLAEASDEGVVFCMPLRTAHGTIGGICLHFHDGTGPAQEQMDLLRSFSNTAAIAIEQARLYDDVRRALTSTSALLQEMHHRVRNNLQTVAALLSMHVRRAGNEPWAWPLREAVNRIRSIAAVHDLLTREDIGVTTVNEVAKLVTDEASTTLVPPGAEYTFHVEGPPAIVSSREATVLAILINELVANAVLHGLEGRTHGTVRVEIALNAGTVMVHVEDDGHGFPPGFRADRDGGLGLQITQNLVTTDLKGEVALEQSALGGGAVVITFTPRLIAVEPFGVV